MEWGEELEGTIHAGRQIAPSEMPLV